MARILLLVRSQALRQHSLILLLAKSAASIIAYELTDLCLALSEDASTDRATDHSSPFSQSNSLHLPFGETHYFHGFAHFEDLLSARFELQILQEAAQGGSIYSTSGLIQLYTTSAHLIRDGIPDKLESAATAAFLASGVSLAMVSCE